jgi:solute:Na+ symporter, SSS family
MTGLDTAIVVAYLAAVLLLGACFFGRQKSLSDYFMGHRNIPWWAAAFSGIATITSAVSFLGAPGQAFSGDLRFLQYRFGTPFAFLIIGWIMIPFFYRLGVFSIYEYLEKRFDLKTRLVASGQFFVLKALFLGIAIYAPSLIFERMTGFPLAWTILLTGLFVTLYTTFGGIKAVIWTDTLQLGIVFGGLYAVGQAIAHRAGGAASVLRIAEASGKLRFFDFSTDLNTEFTVLGGLFGGTFILLSQYGVNQAELQKMLTTSSVRQSRGALASSMVVTSLVGLTYFLIGAGLFVFYSQPGARSVAGVTPDRIFPKFIIEELPAGLRGLLLAAVAAAAMSAVSSILNSLTTVITSDFVGRLGSRKPGVTAARWITFGLGLLCTVAALYADRFGNMLITATRLQNTMGGSLTGVFLLGMTSRRANGPGAFAGLIAGTVCALLLANYSRVSWVWHGLAGAVIAYVGGYLMSLAAAAPAQTVQQQLVWRPGSATVHTDSL